MSDTATCECGVGTQFRSSSPPSPEPPWSRARVSPVIQTLSAAGVVSLTADPTFLDKAVSVPSVPVAITIPDGTSLEQRKHIYIRTDKLATTETFNLAGTFSGFTSLQFDGVGHSAILVWDGKGWKHLAGGAIAIL